MKTRLQNECVPVGNQSENDFGDENCPSIEEQLNAIAERNAKKSDDRIKE